MDHWASSPFIIPVAAFAMVLGIVIVNTISGYNTRRLQSEERLAAIAKGLPIPEPSPDRPRSLRFGHHPAGCGRRTTRRLRLPEARPGTAAGALSRSDSRLGAHPFAFVEKGGRSQCCNRATPRRIPTHSSQQVDEIDIRQPSIRPCRHRIHTARQRQHHRHEPCRRQRHHPGR
jgi:hypothetical protein